MTTEAQRLAALIEVGAQAPTNHAAAAELRRLEAECERLRKVLQEIAWMRKPGVRVSRLVIAMEAAAVMALGKETK